MTDLAKLKALCPSSPTAERNSHEPLPLPNL